jgi:AhpD family alkylhydroperoxidase
MKLRIEYAHVAPGAVEAMRAPEKYVRTCGIEPKLLELIKIRASQINGCAYCLDMHTKDARSQSETGCPFDERRSECLRDTFAAGRSRD